jgi:hypothetical protein
MAALLTTLRVRARQLDRERLNRNVDTTATHERVDEPMAAGAHHR